jgi:hypothetical protein
MFQHFAGMKHPLWSVVLIVLATLMLCRSQADKSLSVRETTAVIVGLQQHFQSGCVFFFYSNVRTDYGELAVVCQMLLPILTTFYSYSTGQNASTLHFSSL